MLKRKVIFWLVICYLITSGVYLSGLFHAVEEWGLNHRFFIKGLASESELASQIVLVGIDEYSLQKLGSWPWPRTYHEKLLLELERAGAKVVGMDLILDQPSNSKEADVALARMMQKSTVVLPVTLDLEMYRGLLGEEIRVLDVYKPLEIFRDVAQSGHINVIPDADGTVRRGFPMLGGNPSFALKLANLYAPEKTYQTEPFWIQYLGESRHFPLYSYYDVLQGRFSGNIFAGKLVLVGVVDPAFGDQFVTPLSQFGLMSGLELHAHQVQTLLSGSYLTPMPQEWVLFFVTCFALLWGYVVCHWKPVVKLYMFGLLGAGYYLYSHYLFITQNLILPYVPAGLLLTSYLIIGMVYSYFERDAEHIRLYQTFHRYLAPQVLQQVLARSTEVQLGGALKNAAVLFIDIRGFTAYTRTHQPGEVVDLLNRYLKLFAEVVFAYEGTLDKYLGDGLMAVFGAPVEGKDDLRRAFEAALEIRCRVEQEGLPLPVGSGLAFGPVVSGNIGSEKRMDFTVIGNTVNTASRLEGLAGAGEIVMTEVVVEQLRLHEVEEEEVAIDGIAGKIKIYRLR